MALSTWRDAWDISTGATIGENTTAAGSKEREMNRGHPMGSAGGDQ
jgi:hypothetical protein